MGTHDDRRESLISIMVGFPLFCIACVQYSSHVGIHTTPFEAHPLLTNGHAMTIAAAFVPRGFDIPPADGRLFQVDADSRLLGHCHWQPGKRKDVPVLVIVHGLEGSSDTNYVRGIAEKAFHRDAAHVIRVARTLEAVDDDEDRHIHALSGLPVAMTEQARISVNLK